MAGMLVFSASFMKAFGEMDKTKGKDHVKPVDDALKKHGVTEEFLKGQDINPVAKPDADTHGDTAKGTYVSKKDGKERSQPIEFRKVDGSWKIEVPMPSGPTIQSK